MEAAEKEAGNDRDSESDLPDDDHDSPSGPAEDPPGPKQAEATPHENSSVQEQDQDSQAPKLYLLADAKKLLIPHTCQGWSFLNSKKSTHLRFEPNDLAINTETLDAFLTGASDLVADACKTQRLTTYLKETAYPQGLRVCAADLVQGLNMLNAKLPGMHTISVKSVITLTLHL